jgi:hypothetical protein
MFKYAFDQSTRVGWTVIILIVMMMYFWDSAIHAIVEHDRQVLEAKYRRYYQAMGLPLKQGFASHGRR